MKSITLHDFILSYRELIPKAAKGKEEIVVTKRGIPYFIVTPVQPRVDYKKVKRNAPTFLRVTKKFKGKKVRSISYRMN